MPAATTAAVATRALPTEPEISAESAEPAPVETALAATTAAPVPAEAVAPEPDEMAAAGAMMSSTFATLNDLKAQINGSDPAPDALQAAVDEQTDAATMSLPRPEPLGAPTKRTVKVIPISPTGTPVTSAASDAIDAAQQVEPRAVALQQVATAQTDPALEPLAFSDPPRSVPAGTPAQVLEVDDNLVNVRSGPSTESEKLWVVKRGDEVHALAVAGDWVQVEISEGKVGWMLGEFLEDAALDGLPEDEVAAASATPAVPAAEPVVVDAEEVAEAAPGGDVRRVTGGGVNVRATASSSGEKLFALGPGEVVTVTGTERGWLRIMDDQGRTGWLYEDFVTRG